MEDSSDNEEMFTEREKNDETMKTNYKQTDVGNSNAESVIIETIPAVHVHNDTAVHVNKGSKHAIPTGDSYQCNKNLGFVKPTAENEVSNIKSNHYAIQNENDQMKCVNCTDNEEQLEDGEINYNEIKTKTKQTVVVNSIAAICDSLPTEPAVHVHNDTTVHESDLLHLQTHLLHP